MQATKELILRDQLSDTELMTLVMKALDAHYDGWAAFFPGGFVPLENDGVANRLGLLFGVTCFWWKGESITAHCSNGYIKDPEGFDVLIKTPLLDFSKTRRAVVMVVAAIGADI